MMRNARISLSVAILLASAMSASPQGPGGGPGPGPIPNNPWLQNGSTISYPGCITAPAAVAGGCLGNGSINAAAIFIGGVPALTGSTLPLANGSIYIGNASNIAVARALSGDCTITNLGVITCTKTSGVAFGALATLGVGTGLASSGGNLNTAAGVPTNTLRTVPGSDSVLPTDCGKTLSMTGALGTLTLPSVSGFDPACEVSVYNASATRGQLMSGLPSPGITNSILWMGQTIELKIVNGAWVIAKSPGRLQLTASTLQMYVNGTSGSDTNNDCLALASPCQTITRAVFDLAYNSFSFNNQTTTQIQVNFAGTSLPTDIIHLAGEFVGAEGQAKVIIDGGGTGVWSTTAAAPVSLQLGGILQVQNITIASGGSLNCVESARGSFLILSSVTFNACGGGGGAAMFAVWGGKIFASSISVGGGNVAYVAEATENAIIIVQSTTITVSNNFTDTCFAYAGASSVLDFTGTVITNSHTVTGTRFCVEAGGKIQTRLVDGNLTYFPGSVGGYFRGGGAYDAVPPIVLSDAATTVSGVLGSGNGGAGTVTGALKADGSGNVSQAGAGDLTNGVTGSGNVVLATTPTISNPTITTMNGGLLPARYVLDYGAINCNSGGDVGTVSFSIPSNASYYRFGSIFASGESGTFTTATLALFSATGGGGTNLTGSLALSGITATSVNTAGSVAQIAGAGTAKWNFTSLTLRNAAAQGGTCTARVAVEIQFF